jgi:hypothetical protein
MFTFAVASPSSHDRPHVVAGRAVDEHVERIERSRRSVFEVQPLSAAR